MADMPHERQVFFERDQIPIGMKALVIQVKVPRLSLVADEAPDKPILLFDYQAVYVEISQDEWLYIRNDPMAANDLARQFGPLIQSKLGASWHRWHDPEPEA